MAEDTTIALWAGVAAACVAVLKYATPRVRAVWRRISSIWQVVPRVDDHDRRIGNVERRTDAVEEKQTLLRENLRLRDKKDGRLFE